MEPLRILLIEDSVADADLLLRELRRAGYAVSSLRVCTAEETQAALDQPWDVVVSDYVMPGFGGLEALEIFKARQLEVPFIVVSGHIGEEIAVAALQAGADDYVMKDRLVRMAPAIANARQRWETRRAHRRAQEALQRSETELRRANRDLTEAREHLEQRVADRTRELTLANSELQRQMAERRRLETELLEIAEAERRKTGFDLHDDLGQRLAGVSLLLAAVQTTLERKSVPEASQAGKALGLIADIINYTHDLADCFSSADVPDADLAALLRQLGVNIQKTFNLDCQIRTSPLLPQLSRDMVVQLFKIAQESLHHAVRRCKASRVAVALECRNSRLTLEVVNDGVPFESDAENRLALRIMNYRARLIGATLRVRTNGHSGTVVTCSLNVPDSVRVPGGSASESATRLGALTGLPATVTR